MEQASIIHTEGVGRGWLRVTPFGIYYVRVDPGRLLVRNAVTGREYKDAPLAAVDGDGRIVAVGQGAAAAAEGDGGLVLRQPFGRAAASEDVEIAAHLLRVFAQRTRRAPWVPGLIRGMIVQPDDADDALTEREREHLVAVARRAGAWSASVWTERPLSDREVVEAFILPSDRLGGTSGVRIG